jgi:hypothetical protein
MFRTEIILEPAPHKISLSHPILCIGSCFADVIGKRLQDNKFRAIVNPFGTLYNPVSIFRLLHDSINNYLPPAKSYLQRDDLYFNFQFHSDIMAASREELESQIGRRMSSTRAHLQHCRWLVISLGTAFYYECKDNGQIVANCHKMPASYFGKGMLESPEIVTRFEQIFLALKAFNQDIRIVLTLSPVRHIRDRLTKNSVSKAALRVAIERITELYPEKVTYFPSYEIMMDDLRDYRFYEADMIHPNQVAQEYIWNKWIESYLDDQAVDFIVRWGKIRKALQHRPFNSKSAAHQRFVKKTIDQLHQLVNIVDVKDEVEQMKKQLS